MPTIPSVITRFTAVRMMSNLLPPPEFPADPELDDDSFFSSAAMSFTILHSRLNYPQVGNIYLSDWQPSQAEETLGKKRERTVKSLTDSASPVTLNWKD